MEAERPACPRYEELPSCDPCGACCREAFDAVPAAGGALPEALLDRSDPDFITLRRVAGRCICLRGDGTQTPYRCTHYDRRPDACRDLERGSANCLLARRRVGLSETL